MSGQTGPLLSALITIRNEQKQLADCLDRLAFVDEIVIVLDKCTDGSRDIAARYTDRLIEGDWPKEGPRRNAGIAACRGQWIFEIDADERVPTALADEIVALIGSSSDDWHEILVDNYIGGKLVRWGWGASFGKAAYPGLFRNGVKKWGDQRVHPSLQWSGRKGPMLKHRLDHYVDRDLSGLIRKLDSYSTARAQDLREAGETWGSTASNIRRFFSRFIKCYFFRKGYREGGYGLAIALLAGLYPLLSHLKAKLESD